MKSAPTVFVMDMGNDLQIGGNQIRVMAENQLQHFESPSIPIRYDLYATVPWIESSLWTVADKGGLFEKTAEYSSTIFFPQVATKGFFNVPVDRVGIAGGDLGPKSLRPV